MNWRWGLLLALPVLALAACEPADPHADHDHPNGDEPMYFTEKDVDRDVGIEVLEEGSGEQVVEKGDLAVVAYEGRDIKGNLFDSNTKATDSPFTFFVGQGGVIQGWDIGVLGMKVGEKRKLEVPYKLGYGEAGANQIRPKSDLIFEVELLDMVKAEEQDVYDFEVLEQGEGREVVPGDTVEIRYEMRLLNGKVVDDSAYHSQEGTVTFTVGADPLQVISGLDDGVRGMKPEEIRVLRLPPALLRGPIGVPLNQVVELEVELVSFAQPDAE